MQSTTRLHVGVTNAVLQEVYLVFDNSVSFYLPIRVFDTDSDRRDQTIGCLFSRPAQSRGAGVAASQGGEPRVNGQSAGEVDAVHCRMERGGTSLQFGPSTRSRKLWRRLPVQRPKLDAFLCGAV
jgi:hypothetical protein